MRVTKAAVPEPGTLYLIALPIGNLRDITYRAVDTLRGVGLIAAEDTRDFRAIQREYAIDTPVVSYHEFNEQTRAPQLVARLLAGESVALVADAGTPLVNDPGFRVVAAAIEAGVPVTSLPGPSAAIAALVASGLPVARFLFLGFPPRSGSRRRAFFAAVRTDPATLVLYEAPHRLIATLSDLLSTVGDRRICLARNLTKPHERYQRGTVDSVLAELRAEESTGPVRGEATVIVAGASDATRAEPVGADVVAEVAELLDRGVDSKAILKHLIRERGLKRREAYDLILKARAGSAP
jgi:16S rRNA (cytidine1402-2'-O)-methyltransferase